MAVYLKRDGLYAGINPNTFEAYADRTVAAEWEEGTVTPQDQYSDIVFMNRQFCVNEHTRQLESRNKGDFWGWGGRWDIVKVGNIYTATCDRHVFALENYTPVVKLHLEQRGYNFVDANGTPIILPGIDMFPALRFFKDNGPAALQPFFDESRRLGSPHGTVWRVWSQGSKKQNNFLDLSPKEAGYYDVIGPFIDCCNANGVFPLLTCYVDNQDVQSPLSHWTELTRRGQGKKVLWSGGNQYPKNGFDPWALSNPYTGAIWSRGSSTDDEQTGPRGATASELHATRQSFERALMDATASPPTMRKPPSTAPDGHPIGGSGMLWMTEGNPFGDSNGYNELQAWKLGRGYSIEWALAVFHNRQSQFGQLMTEKTFKEAAAWFRGLRLS